MSSPRASSPGDKVLFYRTGSQESSGYRTFSTSRCSLHSCSTPPTTQRPRTDTNDLEDALSTATSSFPKLSATNLHLDFTLLHHPNTNVCFPYHRCSPPFNRARPDFDVQPGGRHHYQWGKPGRWSEPPISGDLTSPSSLASDLQTWRSVVNNQTEKHMFPGERHVLCHC